MSLIPRMPAEPERDALSVRVPTSLIEELREYSTFVRGSKDYVITAALERLFKQDREFIKWKQTQTPSAPDSAHSKPSPPAARTTKGGAQAAAPPSGDADTTTAAASTSASAPVPASAGSPASTRATQSAAQPRATSKATE